MAKRVSDEALLGAIGFFAITSFFLSKAAVRGATTPAAAPPPSKVLPALGLLFVLSQAKR